MVSGEEDLTFLSVVEKIYNKADERAIKLKPKLSFVRSISINVDKIKSRLNALVTEFWDDKKIKEILGKIPAGTTIMNVANAWSFLRTKCDQIKIMQIEKVEIIDRIWNGVNVKPAKKDWIFKFWFKEWNQDPVDEMHMDRVKNSTKTMSAEYDKLFKKFNAELTEAEKIKSNIDTFIGLANRSFGKLFEKPPAKPQEVANDVKPLMDRIYNHEKGLITKLLAIENAVKEYNERRMVWVDFLIDLRETMTSSRRSGIFILTSFLCDLCKGSTKDKA